MRFLLISILFAIAFCETSVKINKSEVYDLGATITPTFKQIIPLYYEQFISIASCKDAEIDAGKCCDSQLAKQGWIRQDVIRPTAKEIEELKKKFKDETYNYQIIVNDQYKKIILLFPGTRNSVSQLVQEFLGSTLKDYGIDGIKCQKYFLELFESMKERVFKSLDNIYKKNADAKEYQIIFEGHSLGGATATLHAFEYDTNIKKKYNKKQSTVLITYGSPNVGNKKFKEAIDKLIPTIYRVVKNGDIVATIPPKIALIDFYPTKGYSLIDKDITTLYDCDNQKDGNCKNSVNPFEISKRHNYYFYSDHQIFSSCSTAFKIKIKTSNDDEEMTSYEDESIKFLQEE